MVAAVVAIPVCNEQAHIGGCLRALRSQSGMEDGSYGVLLLLNNCRDGTAEAVDRLVPTLTYPLRVVVRDDPSASAGWARRRAMESAASWLEEGSSFEFGGAGVLLTTDADSRVPGDWIARNRAALDAGADLVAGRLALDADDAAALPTSLLARGALEAQYEALLTEIAARLDPVPGDPWPRHASHSGASLATRLRTYLSVGGMPDIPCGEDRAFVEAVLARDGVVRHDPDIVVVTSGRLLGRAKGGVADTIRLRCDVPDSPCDERLERVGRVVARSRLYRHLRRLHATGAAADIGRIVETLASDPAPSSTFGALRAKLEKSSPYLDYRPLRPSALPAEIHRARNFLRLLQAGQDRSPPADRVVLNPDRIAAEACG